MEEKKVYIVTDLGPGDGGKGGVVHKICCVKNAHTVIKVGGAQGSHGVRTSKGQSFNFSHFGCGTFEGVKTHLSEMMIIEPYRLLEEAKSLKREWGIHDIFSYLTVHENALCVTPFHTFSSQLRELLRKDKPKGTVGIGVGEALRDSENEPSSAVRVHDLDSSDLRNKLEKIRNQKVEEFKDILSPTAHLVDFVLPQDVENAQELVDLFNDEEFVSKIVEALAFIRSQIKVVNSEYVKNNILEKDGVVVIEASHGVLNDRVFGFSPHITHLRILPHFIVDMLTRYEYSGKIVTLGVTRAYQIRHGAGPMVTDSPEMLEQLLPGSNKNTNRWQGSVRVGPLDFVMLNYAVTLCGGPQFFDGLVVTWFDQIQLMGKWMMCDSYEHTHPSFMEGGAIIVYKNADDSQSYYQNELTQFLFSCIPQISSIEIGKKNKTELQKMCSKVFFEKLHIPVRMISFGPTEEDKVLL